MKKYILEIPSTLKDKIKSFVNRKLKFLVEAEMLRILFFDRIFR